MSKSEIKVSQFGYGLPQIKKRNYKDFYGFKEQRMLLLRAMFLNDQQFHIQNSKAIRVHVPKCRDTRHADSEVHSLF